MIIIFHSNGRKYFSKMSAIQGWVFSKRFLHHPWKIFHLFFSRSSKTWRLSQIFKSQVPFSLFLSFYAHSSTFSFDFGGGPAFPFGTGDYPRNCVRVRVRFPPCWKAWNSSGRVRVRLPPPPCWKTWNFSKSYGPSYFFIFRHISPIFLHFSWAPP